ncbi:MAG: hypothetical protein DCC67_03935 [Planctomycetota bacterium]|nr:MAG: hypothetical protein DCC67_03935 [Planctomycetota bacterium]
MNLAVRASELGMGPVLLVETDVQRPKLQRLWRLAPGAGLAELFDGAASLADCLRDGPAADLHVLPAAAGPLRRQPTWETGVVDGLIAEAAADHSLVLFDLPAADCLQQFLMVAQRLDQALLVVRAERSRGPQVERAANCLLDDGVPLSGVILNGQRSYGPQWLLRRL